MQYFTDDGVAYYTQDELDDNLFDAIKNHDYSTFVDMIERGANINKVKNFGRDEIITPLTKVIYHMAFENYQAKFLKYLINSGVELFEDYIGENFDVIKCINTLVFQNDRKDVIDCILKKHPDFMKEREVRMVSNKYNL